jgi:hypothetical protein
MMRALAFMRWLLWPRHTEDAREIRENGDLATQIITEQDELRQRLLCIQAQVVRRKPRDRKHH